MHVDFQSNRGVRWVGYARLCAHMMWQANGCALDVCKWLSPAKPQVLQPISAVEEKTKPGPVPWGTTPHQQRLSSSPYGCLPHVTFHSSALSPCQGSCISVLMCTSPDYTTRLRQKQGALSEGCLHKGTSCWAFNPLGTQPRLCSLGVSPQHLGQLCHGQLSWQGQRGCSSAAAVGLCETP